MSKILLGLILALSFVQYTPTAIAKGKVSKKSKKKKNVDDEITNARMRQASGSKKKWSFSGSAGYYGGSLTNPFGAERINLYDPTGDTSITSLSGSVGIRYRLNPNSSLALNLGMSFYEPLRIFHGSIDDIGEKLKDYKLKDLVISSPSLSWSYYGKFFGKQQSFGLGVSVPTNVRAKRYGSLGSTSVSHSIIFSPKKKISIGVYTGFGYSFYKKCAANKCQNAKGENVSHNKALSQQTKMSAYFTPFFEYAITPKYSFRTVFSWFDFETRHKQPGGCADAKAPEAPEPPRKDCSNWIADAGDFSETSEWGSSPTRTQSVGLGIAYSRDIYIYPNFQFNVKNIKPELSNVAISVNFSL